MFKRTAAHLLCRSFEIAIGLSTLRAALYLGGIY